MTASRAPFCLLLLVLAAAPLRAQVADTTRADSARAVTLAPVVVTASRVPVRADRVGFAFTVVGAARLERERPRFAYDALRTLPGSFIDEAAGPGGPTIVRLRGGEEVFTQILVDGVRINENGGFFDMQGLTFTNLDRIEVARGPQSALFGSSAMSGVVHFITRRGEPGPARVALSAEGGSAVEEGGSYSGAAEASGGTETVRWSAGLGRSFNRGIYALPHDTRTTDGSLRLDLLPSERWTVTGLIRGMAIESKLPVRDPGATRVPLDPNARNERDRLVSSIEAKFAPTPHWLQQVRAAHYREGFVYDDRQDEIPNASELPFVFNATFRLDSDVTRTSVEYSGSYDRRGEAAGRGVALSYGAAWENEALDSEISGDFQDRQSLDRSSTAAFAELLASPSSRVDVLFGVRLEKFQGLDAELTPRASAVLHAAPGALALRAAAGRAYKAPNLQQQYLDNPFIASNPDLRAETSTSWEVGADVQLADGRLAGSLTYFRQRFDNLIRTVAQEGSTRQINRNLGESRAQGVEWDLRFRTSPRWALGTDGAWIATEILENSGLSGEAFPLGDPLPFRPEVVSSGYFELVPLRALTATLRGAYVGEQIVLSERFSGDRVALDPYFLAGLTLGWEATPRVEVYARIDNLFDTQYETAFDRHGIPLTGALGLRLRY